MHLSGGIRQALNVRTPFTLSSKDSWWHSHSGFQHSRPSMAVVHVKKRASKIHPPKTVILLSLAIFWNGARGRTRTGTTYGRGILSPLCLPIPPRGRAHRDSSDCGNFVKAQPADFFNFLPMFIVRSFFMGKTSLNLLYNFNI